MARVLISLSGGLDSAVLLSQLLKLQHKVETITFDYGSKHGEYEQGCAQRLADWYQVRNTVIPLKQAFKSIESNLMQSGGEIPEGHYEDESMKKTVVPGRNTIFTSILLGIAQSRGMEAIALGIHAGDHAIYPDCRGSWWSAMNQVVMLASEQMITLQAPFISISKADIVRIGLENSLPFNLTRTCYKQQEIACGKCGSCCERLEAFAANNTLDPLDYES